MKKTIHIDRPDDLIPGLAELNDELRQRYGRIVVVEIEMGDPERFLWKTCYLADAEDHALLPAQDV